LELSLIKTAMSKMPAARPRLEDVARLAGVSLGSASRALSDPAVVKPKTLARVMQAVAQLGYVRNGAARALASQRTFSVGAVFPTLHNPAYADAIHTLQQTLWSFHYQLVVASHEYVPEREYEVVRSIVERGVDGVILVGAEHDEEIFDLMRHRRLPLVLTWAQGQARYGHGVGFSNRKAAYDLTRTVLDYGHKLVAVACGSRQYNERARERVGGTEDALAERGMTLREEWVFEAPLSYEGGRLVIRRLLAMAERPTVLMCNTDTLAVGALHECRIHGIRVPEDLSITGYDDIELASLTVPALTTVHIPTAEMGTLAAQRIVALIENKEMPEIKELGSQVVVRDSLADISRSPKRTKSQ
jgi:LacI family transcriptional regulator